jgi:hypothetical protein
MASSRIDSASSINCFEMLNAGERRMELLPLRR